MSNTLDLYLNNPPYLQLAVDIPNLPVVHILLSKIVNIKSPRLLLELGTPLIKNEGLRNLVPVFRKYFPDQYLIADLKTLDVGELEVELAQKTGVNACVVSSLAPIPTINNFIKTCDDLGLDAWMDSLGGDFKSLKPKIKSLNQDPDVIIVHRGIDEEIAGTQSSWNTITKFKSFSKALIAIAGGLSLENMSVAKIHGADIFIIGRAIYQSENPQSTINQFLSTIMSQDES